MSRIVSNAESRIEPQQEPGLLPFADGTETRREAIRESPYRAGDIVSFLDGETVRRALVLMVFAKYLERRGYWIPQYRVRVETRAGGWSRQWRYIFPGYIERAFETD